MSLTINPTQWSPDTKKNTATVGLVALAGTGAKYISDANKWKIYDWNIKINRPLKEFAKSEKEFFGSKFLKNIAQKIGKTSGRQKILAAYTTAALATIMGIREHFSKQQGKKVATDAANKKITARDEYIDKQNNKIANLEADLMVKDSEIAGFNKTIDAIEKAAEKLGVDKDLAQELQKQF